MSHPGLSSVKVIGIAGGARTGKDLAAKYLELRGFSAIALAEPMKYAMNSFAGGEILKCGKPPRVIWQQFGTEIGRRIDAELWIKLLAARIVAASQFCGIAKFVVPDVRFLNEAAAIRSWGGRIIELRRDAAEKVEDHASEQEVKQISGDYVIHNNGTVRELMAEMAAAVRELKLEV